MPSCHFEMAELRTRQQELIAWAKEIGMTQMGTASLGAPRAMAPRPRGQDRGVVTMDLVKRAADEYNRIGDAAAKPACSSSCTTRVSRSPGSRPADLRGPARIAGSEAGEDAVSDVGNATVGDPVMYFHKYPGRFLSMHLQGVDLNASGQAGRQGARPQLAVGNDSVDWAKVFAAAKTGGVRNYFIEQSWDLTVQSVAYLKTLKA